MLYHLIQVKQRITAPFSLCPRQSEEKGSYIFSWMPRVVILPTLYHVLSNTLITYLKRARNEAPVSVFLVLRLNVYSGIYIHRTRVSHYRDLSKEKREVLNEIDPSIILNNTCVLATRVKDRQTYTTRDPC